MSERRPAGAAVRHRRLYDAPPRPGAPANLVPLVERITPQIEAMAGASGSELSRGGMTTKIEAGKIATTGGIHMVIAPGRIDHPLRAVADGGRCTWFLTPANRSRRARNGSPVRSSRRAR